MLSSPIPITPDFVHRAHSVIQERVTKTPVLTSKALSNMATLQVRPEEPLQKLRSPVELYFKCENMQKTGSFKFRGALNSVVSMSDEQLKRGLVTTSSGNHGKALGKVARELADEKGFAIPVHVVMPNNAMARKIIATEDCGATVVCSGPTWQERDAVLTALQKEIGSTLISTSTDPKIFLGQGTLGIEFADQMKQAYGNQLDAIIAPCGSGGMLAGLAVALHDTSTRIFGSEPAEGGADDAKRGRDIGYRIGTVQSSSIADGLRCPVGKLPWEIIKRLDYVEDIFSVTDEQIEITMKLIFEEFHMIVEPSAAVPLAVVFFNPEFKDFAAGHTGPLRVGIVLSGGNVDLQNIVDICS